MQENKSSSRYRNFACVVYPDSAPDNWQDIIADAKIPVFISPLHSEDVNPDGEPKKPHHHIMAMYEGKKSKEQVSDFFQSFGGVGVEIVQSLRGYARYLCHLDNPEKAQYDPNQVKAFGGSDYSAAIGLPTDKYKCIREMMDFCTYNQNYCYSDLLEYSSENRQDWFRVLCDSSTLVIKEYLKSKQWKEDRSNGIHNAPT